VIFADTGAFLALYLQRDQYHRQAVKLWRTVEPPVLTSNHVMDELATLLGRQAGFFEAANRVTDLYHSPTVDILESTREDELDAVSLMRKYADQAISFTNCVSFAIMRRQRVRTAFTFDRHFRNAGFRVIGLR
jgi:predicted nucleic acid-binding protein